MSDSRLEKLVTVAQPRSAASEAYRTLRTSIEFAGLDSPIKTLLVTSAGPDEGKSSTLANLAVVSAQEGKRVVVVDCDLRRPSLHTLLGLGNTDGLTSALVSSEAVSAPPLQSTAVDGLLALTSGPIPPNPLGLLGSRRLEELLASLAADALLVVALPPLVRVERPQVLRVKDFGCFRQWRGEVLLGVG